MPLLYGQGCIRSFSYISIVVQFAASMLLCMIRKPAKLTANALLMTTAMKHTAPLQAVQHAVSETFGVARQANAFKLIDDAMHNRLTKYSMQVAAASLPAAHVGDVVHMLVLCGSCSRTHDSRHLS
jgi:hypothetical protein